MWTIKLNWIDLWYFSVLDSWKPNSNVGLFNGISSFIILLHSWKIIDIFSDIGHKWVIFAFLRVELWYIVTKQLCNNKISISDILKASMTIFYKIVEVIKLRLNFFPNSCKFWLVFFVVEKFVSLCDCIKNNSINTCNEGFILIGFAQKFRLRRYFNYVSANSVHLSEFEITMSKPWQVGEIKAKFVLILSEPLLCVFILDLIELEI